MWVMPIPQVDWRHTPCLMTVRSTFHKNAIVSLVLISMLHILSALKQHSWIDRNNSLEESEKKLIRKLRMQFIPISHGRVDRKLFIVFCSQLGLYYTKNRRTALSLDKSDRKNTIIFWWFTYLIIFCLRLDSVMIIYPYATLYNVC